MATLVPEEVHFYHQRVFTPRIVSDRSLLLTLLYLKETEEQATYAATSVGNEAFEKDFK